MKKKRNKFVVMLCIICCIMGGYKLYPRIFKEKGTLYSLKMSKEFKNCHYDGIQVFGWKASKGNEVRNEAFNDCEKQSKEILDYLNRFKLIEVSSKKALENEKPEISYVTFVQCDEECKKDPQHFKMIRIHFYSNSTLKITASYKEHITKDFKIDNGEIDFNYINKILSSIKTN